MRSLGKPVHLVVDNTPRPVPAPRGPEVFIFVIDGDNFRAVHNGENGSPGLIMGKLADASEAVRERIEAAAQAGSIK
jgi:hypothetical protein